MRSGRSHRFGEAAGVLYGGGVINAGPKASNCCANSCVSRLSDHVDADGAWGLSGSDKQWLGMLGMHGTYEANWAMHDCDVMINIGARFDDRITGRLDAFSPHSKKIHVDIDPSSINKNVRVDIRSWAICAYVLEEMLRI